MPNNDYANEPNQSRSEEIIQSILDNTEYDEAARSRIEYLLIELKNAIEGGGGGGGVTSYSPLTEKPKIDNHTLQAGNNTSSDLGLQTKIDPEHKLSADNVDDTNSTNKFNVKSDWNAASGATSEILNKPTLGTASAKNVPASGDAATGEVVLGSDTRLTDARNAKDVYNWAKQKNKPLYNYSEIQNPPTIPDELSDLADDSTHRTVTDTEKDTWNGKQNALTFDDAPTSNSNNPVKSGGVYTALSGKQNNLSEAQMAAANSGATAAKVEQIETNKNNILYNTNNGVKNIVKSIATSGGIFTVNADGTITANGTNTGSTATFRMVMYISSEEAYKLNGMILNGCPSGGNTGGYRINLQLDGGLYTNYAIDKGSGATISGIPQNPSYGLRLIVAVDAGKTVNNIVFKPMIRPAGIGDDTYVPYALPNTAITPALIECVDNGKKNLYKFEDLGAAAGSGTGVTLTDNGDGTFSATGTASGANYARYLLKQAPIKAGNYVITGISGGALETYRLRVGTGSGDAYLINLENNYAQFTIASDTTITVQFVVNSGATVTNRSIKPMICEKSLYDVSPAYQPFAMSNAELSPTTYTAPTVSTQYGVTIITGGYFKVGKLCVVNVKISNANAIANNSYFLYNLPEAIISEGVVAGASICALSNNKGINLSVTTQGNVLNSSGAQINAGETILLSGCYLCK